MGQGELSAGCIAHAVGAERTNVSRHLCTLVSAGVLTVRRDGTRLIYRLRTPCILGVLECVEAALCDPADRTACRQPR